jgi:hypothetical protein
MSRHGKSAVGFLTAVKKKPAALLLSHSKITTGVFNAYFRYAYCGNWPAFRMVAAFLRRNMQKRCAPVAAQRQVRPYGSGWRSRIKAFR